MDPLLRRLVDEYPDEVRVIYRHFPLTQIHDNAFMAAEAAEAAGAQGGFWEFHDALFEHQEDFAATDKTQLADFLSNLADEIGLDGAMLKQDLESGKYQAYVEAHLDEAAALQLPGTPALIVNGNLLQGGTPPFESWEGYLVQLRDMAALAEMQFDAPPAFTINNDSIYVATVTMESGDEFMMELYPQSAPLTVNSFVFLAQQGWFDGVTFHRVLPGFVAQTGDPTGTGLGGPGYTLPNEIDQSLSHAELGTVAMANSGPDTNGSQWYITLGDAATLDGSYTIFGQVVEGLDVVQAITARDPSQNPDSPEGDVIDSITIEEK
ncbi:MAG: cyclophilin family peptidyl-prolyl cis-trans isomerase [Cellvibrionaceae bacterium]